MKSISVLSVYLLLRIASVNGFTPVKPVRCPDPVVIRTRGDRFSTGRSISAAKSPLFMSKIESKKTTRERKCLSPLSRLATTLLQLRFKLGRKLRRAAIVMWSAAVIWAASSNLNIQPCHASTMAPKQPIQERILSVTSPSLDTIVERYVEKYMFDDDTYDPVESLYREAYKDATQGTYPRALKEVTGSVFGQESGKGLASSGEKSGENMFGNAIVSTLGFLKKRGLSESTAIAVLAASFVVAGPFVFLVGGMIIGGASKRNMNKVMKKRYGDTYTVDATIRTEEDVEAPDDEDDDEDEDDEDDDEDDDDEEDDDEEK